MQGDNIRSGLTLIKLTVINGLIFSFAIFLPPKTVGAVATDKSWSWTASKPVVFSSDEISDMATSLCPTAYRAVNVSGLDSKKVCVTGGDKVNFGVTIYYAWIGFASV